MIHNLLRDENRLAWALTTLTLTVVTVGYLAGVWIWTLFGYTVVAGVISFYLAYRYWREERRSDGVSLNPPASLNPYEPPR